MYLTIYFFQVLFLVFISAGERAVFGIMGEKLTYRLRSDLMTEMMHKQIGWFDRKDRAPGIITNVFNADIKALNGMTSETIVTIFEVLLVFTFGMTVCLIVSPPAALNAFIFSPIMIGGSYMMATVSFKNSAMAKKGRGDLIDPYQASNALLADVIINYRTVVSFGQNNIDEINENFGKLLDGPLEDKKKIVNQTGMYKGLGECGRTLYIGTIFLTGLQVLVRQFGCDRESVFFGTFVCFFSIMGVGF